MGSQEPCTATCGQCSGTCGQCSGTCGNKGAHSDHYCSSCGHAWHD